MYKTKEKRISHKIKFCKNVKILNAESKKQTKLT